MESKHLVLVHGMCQGAWCWYKLKTLLQSAGHRVTALDMSASGIDTKPLEEVQTFNDYNQPLISFFDSLPPEDKVVLVGHSLGGLNIAFAMEQFPHKISLAVFLAAFMPDTLHKASYFSEELFLKMEAEKRWLDCEFCNRGSSDEPFIVATLGHKFLSLCYELSPTEDLELAKMLSRPLSDFTSDLAKADKFSDEGYGSVRRAYVICKEDKVMSEEFQLKMIESSGLKEVKVLQEADHMGMMCKTQELCDYLLQLVYKYD